MCVRVCVVARSVSLHIYTTFTVTVVVVVAIVVYVLLMYSYISYALSLFLCMYACTIVGVQFNMWLFDRFFGYFSYDLFCEFKFNFYQCVAHTYMHTFHIVIDTNEEPKRNAEEHGSHDER